MKTNVNMLRKMGDYEITQRTKDCYFNATDLLKQWNKKTGHKKEISKFLNLQGTKDFVEVHNQQHIHTHIPAYVTSKASKGKNFGTWMHPYLFMKFMMWINPEFEYESMKMIHDQLIHFRHLAGDNYKLLSDAGSKLKGYDFAKVATAMQWIVFGARGKELRQQASMEQLNELADLEKKLAFAIDMGYIKSYDMLMNEMRRIWRDKNKMILQN